MARNYTYKEVAIQDLLLDEENPRFASSVLVEKNNTSLTQEKIIEHLLVYSDVVKLAKRINEVGEMHGSEMITCIEKENKYVVMEGNRRTCACKLLLDRKLIPEQYRSNFPFVAEKTRGNIEKIMVTVYPNRESVQSYLSDRHIAGVKRWSALEKNNYYMTLFLKYGNVKDVKQHTTDSIAEVTKCIKSYQFFMDVFNVLKDKYSNLEIEKIDYLPMTSRFMGTLVGNDKEVGLNLDLDEEKLQYVCDPKKEIVYKKILLLIGEAFLIRKGKKFCKQGELHKIVSNEIYAIEDQKLLILEDSRIPGLYNLIQRYKENDGELVDVLNTSRIKPEGITTEGYSGKCEAVGISSLSVDGDVKKDGLKKNDIMVKEKAEYGSPCGDGGKGNLPYFFQGISYKGLDPNDKDSHGVSRICRELQLFSDKKMVENFPMAATFLTRAIIEHSLIYYSKKNKIQGQDKYIWESISTNGKANKLQSIVRNYNANLANYISDSSMREYFKNLFGEYDTNVAPLNWVVHRIDEYQLSKDDLLNLPHKGLLALINFLISNE